MRMLFDDVPFSMGIVELDEDDDVIFIIANASQARFIGLPLERLPGTRVSSFAPPESRRVWREAFYQAMNTGEMAQFDVFMPHGATGPGTYSASVKFLGRGEGGRPRFGFAFLDITARKRLEAEVNHKNEELSREIEERRRAEELLRKKQDEILALSTPLLEVWDGVLALPLIGSLDADRAAHIMEKLLHEISSKRTRVAILDLTGVDAVDAGTASHLLCIARAVGLLGSRCLLSGISPRIAQTMTAIGINAEGFMTFGTLQDALKHALEGDAHRRGSPALPRRKDAAP